MAEKEKTPINTNIFAKVNDNCIKFYHHIMFHSLSLHFIPVILLLSSISNLSIIKCISTILVTLTLIYINKQPKAIYLISSSCYKPSDSYKVTRENFMKQFQKSGTFTDDSIVFQKKMLERSGIGQDTYLPKSLHTDPLSLSMITANEEATTVMFGAIDKLLEKTTIQVNDIGVLVVNCSLFCPTPSLSAMIQNRYNMRGNIKSYNLGGMGCSSGLISIDLAKQLLQVHPNTYALIISMENMTLNPYLGNKRSMLVTNSLFRMGGAAILLSNHPSDSHRSKYQLIHTERTHTGSIDRCFSCINQEEDEQGRVGISLSKDLMAVAGETLKANITTLGPLVLPISEQLLFLAAVIKKYIFKRRMKAYVPNFKLAFEHFCIHAGGRAVLDEIEKNLELSEWHMEPSRMTLYRFGNTSSSSLWYELAYCEAKGRIKKGDRVWQIAFGSGFKCNSAVWQALRTIDCCDDNPWADEIHEFPVHVPKMVTIGI